VSLHPDHAQRNKPVPILSWGLYDFANTIFSILVVTRYLPPMIKELTGSTSPMGLAVAVSMVFAGLLVPVLGDLSDRTGRSKRYLVFSTILCVFATSTISFLDRVPIVLVFFFVANMAYQVSMVFYNSLLPTVCTEDKIGTVSGLGVALGYVGSFFALIMANVYVRTHAVQEIFFLTGLLYLIFSLPLFFWVRERQVTAPIPINLGLVRERLQGVLGTIRSLPENPPVLFFLLGNFFCLDAVNTTIVFYSEYLQNARGIPGTGIDQCLIAVQLSALCFSLLIGRWIDKVGCRTVILFVASTWIVVIVMVLSTESFAVIFIASVLGGFGLGGIWVTGRALILQLSPAGEVGAYMGLYGMTGKFSAIGALFFGILADGFSYDVALAFQVVMLVFGIYFLARIKM
jgi:UMF1 family MFS transporter